MTEWIKVPLLRGASEIRELLRLVQANGGVICGGYARYCASTQKAPPIPADVDVFPTTEEAYENLKKALIEAGLNLSSENEVSANFRKSKMPTWLACPRVNLVKPRNEGFLQTLGTVEQILENFDFTVVRAAIISDTEVLVDKDFLEDDPVKRIRIKTIHCPFGSTYRLSKYIGRGFKSSLSEMLKLFLDWEGRPMEYRERLASLIFKQQDLSKQVDPTTGKKLKLEEADRQLLYSLLKVD